MNHCPPAQNGLLEPVAVQIAARHKSPQTADSQGLVRLRKALYRTPVKAIQSPLSWHTRNATTVAIQGLGIPGGLDFVQTSGSLVVNPEQNTTYLLTATPDTTGSPRRR